MPLPWLNADTRFPDSHLALSDPNGLLAAGGDLSAERLLQAYGRGIFPWYEEGQPILWWSPDPRMVLSPDDLRISKSLRKTLKRSSYRLSMDTAFSEVIRCCAEPRGNDAGTWITSEMQIAYSELHEAGFAHSVEVWSGNELAGGLYGVALGQIFFGESMFSFERSTSTIALVNLVKKLRQWNYKLIDCQVSSEHLRALGATEISRDDFEQKLRELLPQRMPQRMPRPLPEAGRMGRWEIDTSLDS